MRRKTLAKSALAGGIRIRAPRDFWGGLALVALAALAFWLTGNLGGMQGGSFGAGTAPRLFAGLLGIFGLVVAATGLFTDGPPLGLVPSTFAAFMISISGSREMRWLESLIAGAAMTLFCVLLFAYLLKLPFDLWPRMY